MLVVSAIVPAAGVGIASVAAQDDGNSSNNDNCEGPSNIEEGNCEATEDGYTSMLDNLFSIAHTTLQYAGFITVFAGATLWFTARRSSDRAQTGVWLLIGGLAMILFYFGFSAFVALLKWIAEGEA
jgi:hypothetical protein